MTTAKLRGKITLGWTLSLLSEGPGPIAPILRDSIPLLGASDDQKSL
jgi:hypothetical protein